jgi:hypothetical protein
MTKYKSFHDALNKLGMENKLLNLIKAMYRSATTETMSEARNKTR